MHVDPVPLQRPHREIDQLAVRWTGPAAGSDDDHRRTRRCVPQEALDRGADGRLGVLGGWQVEAHGEAEPAPAPTGTGGDEYQ